MRAGREHTWSRWVFVIVGMAATAPFASSCDEEGGDDEALGSDAGLTGNDSGPIVIQRDAGQQASDVDAAPADQQPVEGGPVDAREPNDPPNGEAGLQGDGGESDRDATLQDGGNGPLEAEAGARDAAPTEAAPDARAADAGDAQASADAASNPDGRAPADGAAARADGVPPDVHANDAAQGRGDPLGEGGLDLEPAAEPPMN